MFNGIISFSTSLMLQISLPFKVRLAIKHSVYLNYMLLLKVSENQVCRVGTFLSSNLLRSSEIIASRTGKYKDIL